MSNIVLESDVVVDKYVNYVADVFDLQEREKNRVVIPSFDKDILNEFDWQIGLIIGNSGSGKSTILKTLGEPKDIVYDDSKSIISQFDGMSEEDVCRLFNGVGLNSIPTYLRRPSQLSNGEKSRLDICYAIANTNDDEYILVDEFTSVVNRMCAHSMSFALQRYIRNTKKKIILCSCHYDIIEWIQPDWVFNLNKQTNGKVDIERFIYSDDSEYELYKKVNSEDILSHEYNIN